MSHRTKQWKLAFAVLSIVAAFLVSCSPLGASGDDGLDDPLPRSVTSEAQAADIALQFIAEWVDTTPLEGRGLWSSSTVISSVAPVYNDGAPELSYYECKATTEGADAGYVLVTADNSDIPIPEFNTTGPAQTEIIAEEVGSADFLMYRYGLMGVRAVSGRNGAMLLSKGISNFENVLPSWRAYVEKEGVIPTYSRRQFNALHQNKAAIAEAKAGQSAVSVWVGLGHKYPDGNYTASWDQKKWLGVWLPQPSGQPALNPDQYYPIGCGATAYGVVYSYWQAFKGKSNLFLGVDMLAPSNYLYGWRDSPGIYSSIKSIAQYCDTIWDNNGGGVSVFTMEKGKNYAKDHGYPSTTSSWLTYGADQFVLFDKIAGAIAGDRPPIVTVNVDKGGVPVIGVSPNHYVVAEEAKKTIYRVKFLNLFWLPWANGSTTYKLNICWGNSSSYGHRYVNTCDLDSYDQVNNSPASMWDCWDVNVQ